MARVESFWKNNRQRLFLRAMLTAGDVTIPRSPVIVMSPLNPCSYSPDSVGTNRRPEDLGNLRLVRGLKAAIRKASLEMLQGCCIEAPNAWRMIAHLIGERNGGEKLRVTFVRRTLLKTGQCPF